jgi:hypothetical protein
VLCLCCLNQKRSDAARQLYLARGPLLPNSQHPGCCCLTTPVFISPGPGHQCCCCWSAAGRHTSCVCLCGWKRFDTSQRTTVVVLQQHVHQVTASCMLHLHHASCIMHLCWHSLNTADAAAAGANGVCIAFVILVYTHLIPNTVSFHTGCGSGLMSRT